MQLGFERLQGWRSPSLWAACSSAVPALARLFAGLDPAFPWLSGTGEPRLGVGDETSQKHPLGKGFWVSQEQKLRERGLKHLRERVLWNNDLHSLAGSFLEEKVVPKRAGFIFGAQGVLAGVGFLSELIIDRTGKPFHVQAYLYSFCRRVEKFRPCKDLWVKYDDRI